MTQTTDAFMGLMEMSNIVTIVADGWAGKITESQKQIHKYLDESADTTKNKILAITKDPVSAGKVKSVFADDPRVLVANMKTDMSAFSDLTNVYAVVVVDSGLFNDHSKYLIAIKARDNQCRLTMVA